jgi:hypothetical protein
VLHEPLEPKRKRKEAKQFERNVDDGVSLLLESTHARAGRRVRIGAPSDAAAERDAAAEDELYAEAEARRTPRRAG